MGAMSVGHSSKGSRVGEWVALSFIPVHILQVQRLRRFWPIHYKGGNPLRLHGLKSWNLVRSVLVLARHASSIFVASVWSFVSVLCSRLCICVASPFFVFRGVLPCVSFVVSFFLLVQVLAQSFPVVCEVAPATTDVDSLPTSLSRH